MTNWFERKVFKMLGVESEESLKEWAVTREAARKLMINVITHFENSSILTKEDFDRMAAETNDEIDKKVEVAVSKAKDGLKQKK